MIITTTPHHDDIIKAQYKTISTLSTPKQKKSTSKKP